MTQDQMITFFQWCQENLVHFDVVNRDGSKHFHLQGVRVGGLAVDTNKYYYVKNVAQARALRMMIAANEIPATIH